jgi:hypothetical protein
MLSHPPIFVAVTICTVGTIALVGATTITELAFANPHVSPELHTALILFRCKVTLEPTVTREVAVDDEIVAMITLLEYHTQFEELAPVKVSS